MGSITKYAAINTKVKALEKNFLSSEQYAKLIKCKSYKEAVNYLKENTPYYFALKDYNLEEIHRGELEYILKKYYLKNFQKISHYFSGNYKNLFKIAFIRFQLEDLRIILRSKIIGRDRIKSNSLITYDNPLNDVDYDKLIGAKDIKSMIHELEATDYYKYLKGITTEIRTPQEELFKIEISLDFIYFNYLTKFIKKLNKEDREVMEKIIGTYSDLLNIQWIFRGKKYYKLSPEEVLNYTIYNGYKININLLKKLSYSKSIDKFEEIINTTQYKNVFNYGKKSDYLVEKDMLSYMKNMYLKYKKKHENNISVVAAYLELALIEVRNIISIIESKRYSVDTNDTFKYISVTID